MKIKKLFTLLLTGTIFMAISGSCSFDKKDRGVLARHDSRNVQTGFAEGSAEGFWFSQELGLIFEVVSSKNGYSVISVINLPARDHDRGEAELKESRWEGGVLAWVCYYPSTEYTLMIRAVSIEDGRLKVIWSSTDSEGAIDFGEEQLVKYDEDDDSAVEYIGEGD